MLSKANRIDNGEVVEGCYIEKAKAIAPYNGFYEESCHNEWLSYANIEVNKINPSTLKHSFNNGESWHTEDEIKEALHVFTLMNDIAKRGNT